MTVSNQTNRTSAVGTGSTGQEVPFSFPITASSELTVIKRTTATAAEVTLTETTNYTIDISGDTGGTLTTVTAIETTETIHIIRNTPMTQILDLEQGGSYNAEDIEDALDKNTKLIVENADAIARCMQLNDTDTLGTSIVLPNSVDRASTYLTFDSDGNLSTATTVSTDTVTVSAYMEDVIAAANGAAARLLLGTNRIINVMVDHSAVADGDTDDYDELQAAFDALVDGDTIVFPNTGSDYICKTALTCAADNIHMIGGTKELGSRIDFQEMGDTDGLKITGYGWYIENMTFYCSEAIPTTQHGLVLSRATVSTGALDHTLVHCEFSSHGDDGLRIEIPQTTTLINCKSTGNGGIGFNFDGSLNGGGGGTSVTCIGCWSRNNGGRGCHIKSVTGFVWTGGAVDSNTSYGFFLNAVTAFHISGVDGEGSANGFWSANSTSRGGRVDSCFVKGVATGVKAFNLNACKAVTIDNIVFEAIHASGYHFDVNTGTAYCHIGTVYDLNDTDADDITFESRGGGCTRAGYQVNTIAANDPTPQIACYRVHKTANTTNIPITTFDGGTVGETIKILIGDAFTFVDFGGTLKGNDSMRWSPSSGDFMTCTYDGTNWSCLVSSPTKHNVVCANNSAACVNNQVVVIS